MNEDDSLRNHTDAGDSLPGQALIEAVSWDERGLVPAIVQDDLSGQVLMVAYMNREALETTLHTGQTHFWSRSRQELWQKGATSGNTQQVQSIHLDCDGDSLLVLVDPAGPACHTGERTCFYRRLDAEMAPAAKPFRCRLFDVLRERKEHPRAGSYTSQLLRAGEARVLQKLGEEAIEVIVAAQAETEERLIAEVADLLYHLTVLLVNRNMDCDTVDRELRSRHGAR
jgi:phosphoribosyl-AMP cyclohydrolase / phosphoribosyl-ATP pyrophosphohydrolase